MSHGPNKFENMWHRFVIIDIFVSCTPYLKDLVIIVKIPHKYCIIKHEFLIIDIFYL